MTLDLACFPVLWPYPSLMLKPWSPFLRLLGTLFLAMAMVWGPAVSAAATIEMATMGSVAVSDDMGGMAMGDQGEPPCDLCVADVATDAACPAVGGLSTAAQVSEAVWLDLWSTVAFAWLADLNPPEQDARPPLQPPKFNVLV